MSTRSSREGSTEISVLPYSPQGSTRYGNSRGIYGSSSFCKNYFAWEEDWVHAEYITHIRASPEGDALGADGMCTCLVTTGRRPLRAQPRRRFQTNTSRRFASTRIIHA